MGIETWIFLLYIQLCIIGNVCFYLDTTYPALLVSTEIHASQEEWKVFRWTLQYPRPTTSMKSYPLNASRASFRIACMVLGSFG